ncbi:hypothetical protein SK128_007705, partial [Halocaridina rubra]
VCHHEVVPPCAPSPTSCLLAVIYQLSGLIPSSLFAPRSPHRVSPLHRLCWRHTLPKLPTRLLRPRSDGIFAQSLEIRQIF